MPAERAEDFFEFLSRIGLTKHYGSLDATQGLTGKESRSFFTDGTSGLSKDLISYVGYGVFAGQKPASDH